MASVLLPLPPFWVANTIVSIAIASDCFYGNLRLRRTELHRITMPSNSRSGRAGPILEGSQDRGGPNHQHVTMAGFEPDSYSGRILDCEAQHAGWTHIVLLPRGVDSFMIGFGVLPEPAAGLVPSGWSGSAICRGFYFANFALIVARPAS